MDMKIQTGEFIRRAAFRLKDGLDQNRLRKLTEANQKALLYGIPEEYQQHRLEKIMNFARRESPFYRSQQMPETLKLTDFPVLNKADYIALHDKILTDPYREAEAELEKLSTSGSTGTPFVVPADPGKMNHIRSNFLSVYQSNGYRIGMKRAEFRAWNDHNRFSFWHTFQSNLLMIDISHMGDEAMQAIVDKLQKKKVQVLVLYSGALTALISYLERRNMDPKGWTLEMIFTMGEALPEETYEKAKALFGISPVISYGSNENGFTAVSLKGDHRYHADLFNYSIEILKMDADEPVSDGQIGRIVVTDLYHRAFPMIRYDTGDTGIYRQWKNKEGRLEGEFSAIYGRRGDLIRTTKKEPLSIHVFLNILFYFNGILRQARCIQTGPKTYILELNPLHEDFDQEAVIEKYKSYLGEDAEITVEIVHEIPVLSSGKHSVTEQRYAEYR